ncbi:MAG: hypothetical protein HPY75_09370 [Actinobacteria bacterium]|nr:hypothetical protein [Actinomycetota bacterium]
MFGRLLARVARELDSAEIPYMIIGGQAVLLYGEPRLTRDIDVTLGIGVESSQAAIEVSLRAGLRPLPSEVERFIVETYVLPTIDEESGIRVDFIFSQSSYEREAIARARPVEIGGTKVMFASLEDLIVHKVVAGRPRDLEDARIVMAKNPHYDREYILKWLREFDEALQASLGRTFEGLAQMGGDPGPS